MSDGLKWVKARASGSSGGNCVEIAFDSSNSAVGLIRDSKRPEAEHVTSTRETFAAFLTDAKNGVYDLGQ